jgi:ABC-type amino acid transport substrate-binding protein
MKQTRFSLVLSILALLCSIIALIVLVAGKQSVFLDQPSQHRVSLYEKVLKAGKIRAAYTIYPPGCFKDENGKLIGVFVETLEQAAKNLNLTVEWTEEVGWATQIEGLDNDRYDMIGSSVWTNPKRARLATLSTSLYYSPLYIYARKNDKFNDKTTLEALNSPDVRISTVDGGTGETIAKIQFPEAQRISLPQMTDFGVSFMDVIHKKADIVIMEPFHAMKFLEANPGTIVNITPSEPLRVFGNSYMFKRGELEFQNMLNVTITDLLTSGFIEQLLSKYEHYPNTQLRVARPYRQDKPTK